MRIKFNRASIDSTMNAAIKASHGEPDRPLYVFPTGCGFAIDREPAPFGGRCYKVQSGQVEKVGDWK